ncbi:DUF2325 domain-containing protein (plasmid) [Alkalihalobacillus hwajinpoensis]|uniref:DUF2325 domain-containing protein n=1 Tax=Guptibacillus hwajinpoensis TaxID=208199 RepID=UPI001883464A|nr:DUF2325 domain-containing protein [Pseudalkalibacillus hwajinpoensis]MBF0706630.1 DUF2325 domain-containing protein [Pseudalkalibacillus hwajinpoensis]
MNKTIAIFGGSQEKTYQKIGAKHGCKVLFHQGKTRNGGNKKEFRNIIKKADIVVCLVGALGHVSMDVVKEISKKNNKTIVYHNGFGASGAIQSCITIMSEMQSAA